jgi:hypothetical protein
MFQFRIKTNFRSSSNNSTGDDSATKSQNNSSCDFFVPFLACLFSSLLLAGVLVSSEAGLFNRSSCLAPTLGDTKFVIVKDMILVTLCRAT